MISQAEREFLRHEWRWAEINEPSIKARHSGAREALYTSFFITRDGALAALNIIHAATSMDKMLVVATVDAALSLSFKQRPRTVRLLTSRYGNDVAEGRLMLVERMDVDHGAERTTLYLIG